MLPLFPPLKTWVFGGQTCGYAAEAGGSGEGLLSVWGAFHCALRRSSGCQRRKEDGASIAWKTLTELHSTVKPSLFGDLQAKVPERILPTSQGSSAFDNLLC